MDHERTPPLGGSIPRLSRLPMPRGSQDNLKLAARNAHDDVARASHLPRPSVSILPPVPLGENINSAIKSRYGWTDGGTQPRSRSPVRDALIAAQSTPAETTHPGASAHVAPVLTPGKENPPNPKEAGFEWALHEAQESRRPAVPSLSGRSVETVSPLPAGSGTVSYDAYTGLPLRPASGMRTSRPSSPAVGRTEIPGKRAFRPPGRSSPTKEGPTATTVSPGTIYTPPKAFVRDKNSRIAKPLREARRSVSTTASWDGSPDPDAPFPSKVSSQTVKVKATSENKTPMKSSGLRTQLVSLFRDPPPAGNAHKLAVSLPLQNKDSMRPGARTGNTTTPSTPRATTKVQKRGSSVAEPSESTVKIESGSTPSPKSSAALREAIAKAKAARKGAQVGGAPAAPRTKDSTSWLPQFVNDEVPTVGENKGVLRKRIHEAAVSGQLNISTMNLKRIPSEVLNMYNPEQTSVNWSEMVDLVKLSAAANEIEEIEETIFPDWSASEVADDDDKSSQFGGLHVLDLHRNLLSAVPIGLRRLERLHTLNLSHNKLSNDIFDIVCQMPSLKELLLADNNISGSLDFNIEQLQDLELLDVHGNQIESLSIASISNLSQLKRLDASRNKLSELPWERLALMALVDINVSGNQLSGTLWKNVSGFESLRTLDVSSNSLDSMAESEVTLPRLHSLRASRNRFKNLPHMSQWHALHTLQVSDNQLEAFPSGMADLQELKNADLSNNNIRLVDAGMAKIKSLTTLNLVGNPLSHRKYLTMSTAELKMDLEKRLQLTEDGLSVNALSTEPDPGTGEAPANSCGAKKAYRYKPVDGDLDLSSQGLTSIDPEDIDLTASGTPIHTLHLSNNELVSLPVELLSHPCVKYTLKSLDLSHNPHLHPTAYLPTELFLPSLRSLYIVSTGLTSLDGLTSNLKAPALTELNISCHRLTGHVPWVRAWYPTCTTLLATDNWFSSIDVEAVRGLEVLDIRNNEIETLPPRIGLLGNTNPAKTLEPGRLRVLEVAGNKFRVPRISVVEKGTEAVLRDLRRMVPESDVPDDWIRLI